MKVDNARGDQAKEDELELVDPNQRLRGDMVGQEKLLQEDMEEEKDDVDVEDEQDDKEQGRNDKV